MPNHEAPSGSTQLADTFPADVLIVDVSPRDGLQNEAQDVSTADKVRLINMLSHAGIRRIEATSFVSPRAVPRMADAAQVMAAIERKPGVEYAVLVPNLRGMEAAIEARADIANVVVVATESFSQRNVKMSLDQSMDAARQVSAAARDGSIGLTAVLGAAFYCPFEGTVPLDRVMDLAGQFVDMGISELTLGDTVGAANPRQVAETASAVLDRWPTLELGLHLHDTRGLGLANALAGITSGVRRLEVSTGGVGGCPFAPNATGNATTEDLVFMLESMGIATGIDIDRLIETAGFLRGVLGKDIPSHLFKAGVPMPVLA